MTYLEQCRLYDEQRLVVVTGVAHLNDCKESETVRSRTGGHRQQPLRNRHSDMSAWRRTARRGATRRETRLGVMGCGSYRRCLDTRDACQKRS